jgi:molybdenum cofactor cytidylyltransferase
MAMGAGGLLVDTPVRPLPRAEAGKPAGRVGDEPKVAALVLAAGQSRRMGSVNKLLQPVDGAPMVVRAVDAVLASRAANPIVVVGHEAERVRAALAGRKLIFVENPDYADGLSTSLRRGVAAVPADADAVLVCLGDMPRISAAQIDRLIAAFNPLEGRAICLPTHRGKRGNPVLWARRFLPEMMEIAGDVGARHLLGEYADQVCEVEMDEDSVLLDIDTPEALRKATG